MKLPSFPVHLPKRAGLSVTTETCEICFEALNRCKFPGFCHLFPSPVHIGTARIMKYDLKRGDLTPLCLSSLLSSKTQKDGILFSSPRPVGSSLLLCCVPFSPPEVHLSKVITSVCWRDRKQDFRWCHIWAWHFSSWTCFFLAYYYDTYKVSPKETDLTYGR